MHGDQIQALNSKQDLMEKKGLTKFSSTNPSKTFFAPINKTSSNRFS